MSGSAEIRKRKFSTDLPSEVYNLEWKLSNFRAMIDAIEPFKTAELVFDAGQSIQIPTKWKFHFNLKADNVVDGKLTALGIYLKLIDFPNNPDEIFAAYSIAIKKADGISDYRTFGQGKSLEYKKNVNKSWGFPQVFSKVELDNLQTNLLQNGSLVMNIKFELFRFGTNDYSVINTEEDDNRYKVMRLEQKSKSLILDGIQNLFEQGHNSDFKIIMKDGKEFPVHKHILASQSPVFLALFNSGMEEASSGTVQVDDLSSEAMEVVLKFMYSGTVDASWKGVVEEIVYAAEKYSLTLLKEFCDTMMLDVVTPENLIDLLKLARKFKLETAEKELFEYASENVKKVFDATILT